MKHDAIVEKIIARLHRSGPATFDDLLICASFELMLLGRVLQNARKAGRIEHKDGSWRLTASEARRQNGRLGGRPPKPGKGPQRRISQAADAILREIVEAQPAAKTAGDALDMLLAKKTTQQAVRLLTRKPRGAKFDV